MPDITTPGVTHKTEDYKDFVITWQEPPMMSGIWAANIATSWPQLLSLMGRNGAEVIEAGTRDEMIAKAKKYIDGLLG